jgi:hypothetical protein
MPCRCYYLKVSMNLQTGGQGNKACICPCPPCARAPPHEVQPYYHLAACSEHKQDIKSGKRHVRGAAGLGQQGLAVFVGHVLGCGCHCCIKLGVYVVPCD